MECDEESDGFGSKSDGNKDGNNQLAMGACDKEGEGGKAMAMGIRRDQQWDQRWGRYPQRGVGYA